MPYTSNADLPAAFKNLPEGAKTIARRAINQALHGKAETQALVEQAMKTAWAAIKAKYKKAGEGWVQKGWLQRLGDWLWPTPQPQVEVGLSPDGQLTITTSGDAVERSDTELAIKVDERTGEVELTRYVDIAKVDAERRLVWGIVLQPGSPAEPDSQGDWETPEEIEKAAHAFLSRYRRQRATMTLQHKEAAPAVDIVESYIAPLEFSLGEQPVTKGSWVLASYVGDDKMWGMVKSGELTGYSIGGRGKRVD